MTVIARHRPGGESRRTNITVEAGVLDSARALGVNISAVSEAALRAAIRAAEAEAWARENAEALAERRAWAAENDPPLLDHVTWLRTQ